MLAGFGPTTITPERTREIKELVKRAAIIQDLLLQCSKIDLQSGTEMEITQTVRQYLTHMSCNPSTFSVPSATSVVQFIVAVRPS